MNASVIVLLAFLGMIAVVVLTRQGGGGRSSIQAATTTGGGTQQQTGGGAASDAAIDKAINDAAEQTGLNADVATLQRLMSLKDTLSAGCWMLMPSGCNRTLTETGTPSVWFRAIGGDADPTACAVGAGDYNASCGRNDAINHWVAPPPPPIAEPVVLPQFESSDTTDRGYLYRIRLANSDGTLRNLNGFDGPYLSCTSHEAFTIGAYCGIKCPRKQVGPWRLFVHNADPRATTESTDREWHIHWHQGYCMIKSRQNGWNSGEKGLALSPPNGGSVEGPMEMALATDYQSHYWDVTFAGNTKHGRYQFQIGYACNFHDGGCLNDFGLQVDGDGVVWFKPGRGQASWWYAE